MPFFDSLSKKVGDVAKTAAKKSEELLETTKLNRSISAEEDKIKGIMSDIGKAVYKKYQCGQSIDEDLLDSCRQISEAEKNIAATREKIMAIKNETKDEVNFEATQQGQYTGTDTAKGFSGIPQMHGSEVQTEPQYTPAPAAGFCSSCGAPISEGVKFCSSCGNRL